MKKIILIFLFLIVKQINGQTNFGFISAQAIGDGLGGIDNGNCVKVDGAGNIYVIGDFQGMVDFDPSPAIVNLTAISTNTSIANSDIFFAKYSPSGNLIWAKHIGSAGDDEGHYIDISPNGNITLTGVFQGTVDFDPSSAVANLVAPGDMLFLAQYDNNGNYLWANKLISAGQSRCQGLNSDNVGNIFISGWFANSADFDPSPSVALLTSASVSIFDVFIAKYDGAGNYLWAKNVGGTGYDFSNSQILDNSGNIYITGTFSTTTDFDPSPATATIATAGLNDIFIAKYDAFGNYIWAKSLGSPDAEEGRMLAKDNTGNIYLTGNYYNSLDFDPSPSTAILNYPFNSEVFIAKYDQNGNYLLCSGTNISNAFGATCILVDNANDIYIAAGGAIKKCNSQMVFQFSPLPYTSQIVGIMSLATNANNDMVTTGGFHNTSYFNSTLTTTLTSLVATSFYLANYNASGTLNWCFTSRDGTSDTSEEGTSIKTDAAGNTYVTGTFDGQVDFDPSPSNLIITSNQNSQDIFLLKYNAAGNLLWVKTIGGKLSDGQKVSLELDVSGNIYLTGHFSDTTDFDPSSAIANLIGYVGGVTRVFIAKYDNSGNYIWAKAIDGHPVSSINVTSNIVSRSIDVDVNGNVFIIGMFKGVLDFDPSASVSDQTSQNGNYDIFFAKYDANGNYVWAKQIGGFSVGDYGECIKIDSNGDLLLTGAFTSTCDFDPSPSTATITSMGSFDPFIAKYDGSGNYIWAKAFGGSNIEIAYSMELNASNEIFLTGDFSGTCDFDPSAGVANLPVFNSSKDIFIAKYDASGNYLWAKNIGGSDVDHVNQITLDASQNIYVTGYFKNIADFDPSASVINLFGNTGSEDVFLAKYDPTGNYLFAANFGGPLDTEAGAGIACDINNNISITGYFRGATDFDFGPLVNYLESKDTWVDIFIAKYANCSSSVSASSPSLTALSPTICINSNSNLIVSSGTLNAAANWQWYNNSCGGLSVGSGTSISVSPTTTTIFYARGEGPCVNSGPCNTVIVNVNNLPVLNITGNNSVCIGSSANFTVNGAITYTWNTNANTTTINVLPSITTTYNVSGTDVNNCVNSQTVNLIVNNTCADVWPGDANSDGVADNLDVLELGLHFTQTGAVRTPTSNSWQSYFANNWAGLITNGKNLNHSDCNGSGLIDQNDTLAVFNNYGFIHAFKNNEQAANNPQLSIVPDQNFVTMGNWGSASIYFGDSLNPISTANGIAYTLGFDKTYIEQDSVYIKYPLSFLNPSNQNLHFRKRNFNNGVIYTATTHTNNVNVNGYGKIATFHFKVKASLSIDTVFSMSISQANQSSANGIIAPLTTGTASLMAIGATVNLKENSSQNSISIYPNPTKSSLKIKSDNVIQKIEILSITGQILLNEVGKGSTYQLNLELFANGTYFIKVYTANEPPIQKIIIKN